MSHARKASTHLRIFKSLAPTLLIALLGACRTTAEGTAPPEAAPHAHGAAATSTSANNPARTNRDPHGNPDVERYIDMLQSSGRIETLRIPEVVARLAIEPDAIVGDLGCGPGNFALAFAAAAPRGLVYACDVEPAQLDALRAKIAGDAAPNIIPVLASFDDPHFPPGRMDLVFIGDTYHHLQDRVEYMRRLKPCLAPGGRLAILDYKPGDLPIGPPRAHKLEAGVMERELVEAGWTRVAKHDTHPWHDFEVWTPSEAR
jgi:SAM-dependent methyltransferase